MATALGVVLRGVAASLALLTLGVVVIGVGLNAFYRAAPVVDVTRLLPRFDPAAGNGPAPFPAPTAAVWRTLAVGAAIAAAAWVVVIVGLLASNDRLGLARAARNLFRAAVGVTAVVAVYAVAVPVVVWAMARLTWATRVESPVPAASFTAVATTLLTWFGALASTLWRRTERLAAGGGKVGPLRWLLGRRGQGEVVEQQVATGFGQSLIVWAVHAVLAFVFVFVAAWTTAAAHRWPAWVGLALLGVLVGAGFLIDQTWLSLHPFYRRRLASAFAVRRAHMPDGGTGALAYEIEEPTTLSRYGGRPDGFPQVIFVGAAALSGQSRTPPGRRSAAFTMSADYVGGPDVGWVRTSTLEETCKPALRRDVTVQAAMAVSGAAIASAMGRHAAAVQRLLALSNVRLGTGCPTRRSWPCSAGPAPAGGPRACPTPAGSPTSCARSSAPTRPRAECCCAPTAATGRTWAWSSCCATAAGPSTASTPAATRRRSPLPWPRPSPWPTRSWGCGSPCATPPAWCRAAPPRCAPGGPGAAQRPPVPVRGGHGRHRVPGGVRGHRGRRRHGTAP